MFENLKKVLAGLLIILGLVFFLFIINQLILFFNLLNRINTYLAYGLTGILVLFLLYMLAKIGLMWFRAPKVPILKADASQDDYQTYLDQTISMLKKNSNLKKIDFESKTLSKEDLVTEAFDLLDQLSLPLIKGNANTIFISTAVSQNGSLDSILVLTSMIKMIWQLANLYKTRPSLRSIGKLYLQVASVILMARSIEDADLIEDQMEPLIAAILGESLASTIPGMVPVTNLIVSSIMEGSVNAYLALRVGLVSQAFLGMEVPQSKNFIRKNASLQALSYMGSIIGDNSKLVVKTMVAGVKKAGSKTAKKWFKKN
ncbi:MAG: DUF697 domain-containing protein [Tissierellia bacterium]|nr:DUF697 domain-containing protein [Tissierellia bacterium]